MKTIFNLSAPDSCRRSFIFLSTALLTFVGAAAWMLSTTYSIDDFLYCREVLPGDDNYFWFGKGPVIEHFSQIWPSFVNHLELINSRLANFGHILFQLLPRQVEMCFTAVMLLMMFLGMLAVGQGGYRRIPGRPVLAATVLMMWCAFPWYDHMQSADYLANYVWTSALWIPVVYMLPSLSGMSRRRAVCFYLLAAVASMMHESFTCVAIAFVFFYAVAGGKLWRCPRYWLLELMMLLFVAMAFFSGIEMRAISMTEAFKIGSLPYFFTRYISACWPLFVAVSAAVVCRIRLPREIWCMQRPFFVACAGASVVSLIIAVVLAMLGRALWPLSLFSAFAVARAVALLWPDSGKADVGRSAVLVWLALMIVYALWFAELVRWQRLTTAEQLAVEAILADKDNPMTAGDVCFFDYTPNEQYPFYLMSMADNHLVEYISRKMFSSFVGRADSQCIAVIPTKYAGEAFEDMPEVPGGSGLRGEWPLFVSTDSVPSMAVSVCAHEFLPQATPIDRALVMALDRSFTPRPRVSTVHFVPSALTFPDGGRGYAWFPGPLQRLVRGRRIEVLGADTVAAGDCAVR